MIYKDFRIQHAINKANKANYKGYSRKEGKKQQ